MSDNTFGICHKIICILDCSDPDCICITRCVIYNLLSLCRSLRYNLICLRISLLHDLMLADKLCRLYLRFFNHRIRLCLCIRKNRISVCDNLLITFNLVRSFQTKFSQKLF